MNSLLSAFFAYITTDKEEKTTDDITLQKIWFIIESAFILNDIQRKRPENAFFVITSPLNL
uniref:Uncharacterized protein n=1 Tax=Rhizophagus irregularis (strain DAOM 181602 / DAOM 197198 / MUCL 43194) TaxID=747089 RepID=U9TPS7_RHIID